MLSVAFAVRNRENDLTEPHRRASAFFSLKALPWETLSGDGAEFRKALERAGERVLVTDSRLPVPIKESARLLEALDGGFDIAIGSRDLRAPGVDVRETARERFSRRLAMFSARLAAGGRFADVDCPFRCFTKQAALALLPAGGSSGALLSPGILAEALKAGLRVKEAPVMWGGVR